MKKIVMLTMLLVSASTFMMAQTPIEQAREKAKALIKGGVTDISKILPKPIRRKIGRIHPRL